MSTDTTTTERLRWVKLGTKNGKAQWALRGPMELVKAAAAAGEVDIVKIQTVHVAPEFYDLGDDMGELVIVKPTKAEPAQRVLVSMT